MPKADLVLEGGGVKGVALVGAITVLKEHGYEFNRVAGTSAGSIVGALVAADMPVDDMVDLMRTVDYRRFQDEGIEDRFPGGKLFSILVERGIYEGNYLKTWLAEVLERRGIRTFGDLRLSDPGSTLPPAKNYRLVVMASDVSTGRLRRLPWDYGDLGYDAADVPVVDAVRASMSIPFFYEPVRLENKTTGEDVWLVDGGMLSNFPVEVFDRQDGKAPRWPTFGIKLSARRGAQTARFDVHSTISLARAMVGTMTSFHDQMHIDDESVVARTIFVDTAGVKATDFDLDRETADRLYASGRAAAEKFLETWDFDGYVATYRSAPVPGSRTPAEGATSRTGSSGADA